MPRSEPLSESNLHAALAEERRELGGRTRIAVGDETTLLIAADIIGHLGVMSGVFFDPSLKHGEWELRDGPAL